MRVLINKEMKATYPDTTLLCIEYEAKVGKNNAELWDRIDNVVTPAMQTVIAHTPISQMENIASARKAFRSFGKDPCKYRVSSEALLRRLKQGKQLYKINNAVDTCNMLSIETGLSVGIYNMEEISGDVVFKKGKESEQYKGIGKDFIKLCGLPILCDDKGAFGSPTSDSLRTMIRDDTTKFLTCFFVFGKVNETSILEKATNYLVKFADAKILATYKVE